MTDTGAEILAFVRALPGWPWPEITRAERIRAGLTNDNWVITDADGRRRFLKFPGMGTERYIDRSTAHAAAVIAAQTGVGPAVLYFDRPSGVQVLEYLEGYRSSTEGSLSTPESALEIARLYRRLHRGALLPQTKSIFEMYDEHLEQIAELDLALSPWVRGIMERWTPAQTAFLASGLDLVPAHNDMHPANYMVKTGEPMKLIDYDYASNNEAAYEIGGFSQVYMLDEQTREAMVEEYYGRYSIQNHARVRVAGLACDVKWGIWGLINAAIRDSDTDYAKFGYAKLLNADLQLSHPDFDEWVRAL